MSAAPRFFVEADALRGGRASVVGAQARQIADVLRLSAGDEIVLVGDGEEARVRLATVTRGRVEGVVVTRGRAANEPRLRLTLALPLLRGERAEEVVEAVTQLGVSRIVPFTSERSVVRGLSDAKRQRWERIARESAETARRGRVPELGDLVRWHELFDVLDVPVFVAWEEERGTTLRMAIEGTPLRAKSAGARSLSVVVGPEGGLSREEVASAAARGAITVSLGPRNLRAETAAVAAIAQAFALLPG